MKVATVILGLNLALHQVAFPFSFQFGSWGSSEPEWQSTSSIIFQANAFDRNLVRDVDYALASHHDDFTLSSRPGFGEHRFYGGGDSLLPFVVNIVAGPEDLSVDSISVSLHYDAFQMLLFSYNNYSSVPFEAHYDPVLRVFDPTWTTQSAAYVMSPGVGDFVLDLPVGIPFVLEFDVDPLQFHLGLDSWQPTLIDPNLDAEANIGGFGYFVPLSLKIVPEPSTGATVAMGAMLFLFGKRRMPQ